MLCPRCQSDNKPGSLACWNCLSPLDGALAQRFAQKPPDPSTVALNAGKQNKGGAFWAGIGIFSFVLFVGSLLFFWNVSKNARQSLPADAAPAAAPAAETSAATGTETGYPGAAGATTGAATAGATSDNSSSSSSSSTTTTSGGSDTTTGGAGKNAINAAMKDSG